MKNRTEQLTQWTAYKSIDDIMRWIALKDVNSLSDDQKDALRHIDDFEAYMYETDGCTVRVLDSINLDILGEQPIAEFIRDTIEYLKESF